MASRPTRPRTPRSAETSTPGSHGSLAALAVPVEIEPMEAKLVDALPDGAGWQGWLRLLGQKSFEYK